MISTTTISLWDPTGYEFEQVVIYYKNEAMLLIGFNLLPAIYSNKRH